MMQFRLQMLDNCDKTLWEILMAVIFSQLSVKYWCLTGSESVCTSHEIQNDKFPLVAMLLTWESFLSIKGTYGF